MGTGPLAQKHWPGTKDQESLSAQGAIFLDEARKRAKGPVPPAHRRPTKKEPGDLSPWLPLGSLFQRFQYRITFVTYFHNSVFRFSFDVESCSFWNEVVFDSVCDLIGIAPWHGYFAL